ncbi:MAG: tRNA threonylcarbamoyladenosine dehydratase [Clostridiales bacterium]|jgi:tRNA A37 threonylcarbamoyladenosine dehydratase|nr:tRNA threonylcarbamoyladenosine dehydratase [Clostridiales bacterium]
MVEEQFSRTALLLGEDGVEKLSKAHVAVFGLGGVGSFAAEALIRSGIKTFSLIDNDIVTLSNLNRQLIATKTTIGRAKTDVLKNRMLEINPAADITLYTCFFSAENESTIPFAAFDYIIDAIDTVTSKILIIEKAHALSVPVISAMGAGNKLDPTRFEVADIYETSVCPLAKVMRKELKERKIPRLKVVYSKEPALKPLTQGEDPPEGRKRTPGSVAFVPSVAGLIIAGEVIKDIAADVDYR